MELRETLLAKERALASPEVRAAASMLDELLHEDFVEFGASGRVFNKDEIIALLREEQPSEPYGIESFEVSLLGEGAALATYRIPERIVAGEQRPGSLRSSLWVLHDGAWRIRFHQGTRQA